MTADDLNELLETVDVHIGWCRTTASDQTRGHQIDNAQSADYLERLSAVVRDLRERREADRRLIASTDQALTRALERAETAEGHTLFEGTPSDLYRVMRDTNNQWTLAGRRVRVVAADPAPTGDQPC